MAPSQWVYLRDHETGNLLQFVSFTEAAQFIWDTPGKHDLLIPEIAVILIIDGEYEVAYGGEFSIENHNTEDLSY